MGLTETCRALGAGRSARFGFACSDHLPAPWADLEEGIHVHPGRVVRSIAVGVQHNLQAACVRR